MAGTAVEHAHMDVGASAARKAFEEIVHKFRLQITDARSTDFRLHDRHCTAAEIYGGQSEGLVHGHQEVASPQDAAPVAQSAVKDLSERNAHVLHGVVLIYIQVSAGGNLQIETAVPCKEFQHVVEKTDSGCDLVLTAALDAQINADLRFSRLAVDACLPHARTSGCGRRGSRRFAATFRKAAIKARVWSSDPTVNRTQPSHPGSELRSRTRIPRSRRELTKVLCSAPMRTRTKLPWLGQ